MSAVELVPHDPSWAVRAGDLGRELAETIGTCGVRVEHIGSTAIPGIAAKPTFDLIPVVSSLAELEARRDALMAAGYEWRGEFGLPGRRYLVLDNAVTGARLINAHCYTVGSPEITRHLAFRDYLRGRPDLARDYDALKRECAARYPDDLGGYCDCKDEWIKRIEAEALAAYTN